MLIRPLTSRTNTVGLGLVVLVLVVPFSFIHGFGIFGSLGAFLVWTVVALAEMSGNKRYVEIDAPNNSIVVHDRTWAYRKRERKYSLQQFRFVISYITPGKNPVNRVELLTQAGGEALWLASYPVRASERQRAQWSLRPKWQESTDSSLLREQLTKDLHLEDKGFVGSRWPGAHVRHDEP